MNILQIGSYLYPDLVGGAEISAQNIYGHLTKAGHRVVRLRWHNGVSALQTRFLKQADGEWLASARRPYDPIEVGKPWQKILFYAQEFVGQADLTSLRDLLDQENIDCIIVHSTRGLGYNTLRALSNTKLPVAIFLHDLALVCMNKSMVRKGSGCRGLCAQCKIVKGINLKSIESFDRAALIGPSSQIVSTVKDLLSSKTITYNHIPNPNEYNIVPRPRIGGTTNFTVGYVGRLEKEKGIEGLLLSIDALREKHSVQFVIAGAGTLLDNVREYASTREWVQFLGFVPPSDMPAVYDSLDCLVVPSLWPENFPGVAVQAITSGAPVVAFNTGGIGEIVENGTSGFLVPSEDFSSLEAAVFRMIREPELWHTLSRNAIAASKRYAPAALGKRIVDLVEDLVVKSKIDAV